MVRRKKEVGRTIIEKERGRKMEREREGGSCELLGKRVVEDGLP